MGNDFEPFSGMSLESGNYQELPVSQLNSVVMPIIVVDQATISLVGTGFNIVPAGVVLTAKHVVLEAIELIKERPGSSVCALWVGSGANDDVPDLLGGPIPVRHFNMSTGHDVAALQLQGLLRDGEPFLFPCAPLDSNAPEVGSRILGVGYTKMDVEQDVANPSQRIIALRQSLHASNGHVLEVYPERRDSVMINFPSFQTSARFDPGMSGGPVFNGGTGRVCGLVCSGISEAGDCLEYTSFAALVENCYGLELVEDHEGGKTIRISTLIELGVVGVDVDLAPP